MFNGLISKYQVRYDGVAVELSNPSVRYVKESDGTIRPKDTGVWAIDTSTANAAHTLTALNATACGYGHNLPSDLPNETIVMMLFDGDDYINRALISSGKYYVGSRAHRLTPGGAIDVHPYPTP